MRVQWGDEDPRFLAAVPGRVAVPFTRRGLEEESTQWTEE